MRNPRTSRRLVAPALGALLVALLPLAAAQDPASDDPGAYGRVRYADRGLTIERSTAGSEPEGSALTNAPVFPGDTVRTDRSQRVEIELSGGTLVRLAERTEMTFLALPDAYAEVSDHTVLQLRLGTARVAGRLAEGRELRIDTPSASIYSLGGGDLRVDVTPDGTTLVSSMRGVAEVAGSGGSVVVRGGMRTAVRADDYPTEPEAFHTLALDDFDRWVSDRDEAFASRDRYGNDEAYEQLPQEVRPYYRELSASGRWTWTEDYGYVWIPSGVAADWRPYYDGYWSYGPRGYFWVSSDPWGWAPYHYGRWAYSGVGWCWIPGRVFAGAWVAWSWGSAYIGWAPLGYWNQPVYVRNVYYGYYDPGCWTFVSYSNFCHRASYRGYAVAYRNVDVRNHVVVTRAPSESPRRLADSVDARREASRQARLAPRVTAIERDARPSETMRDVERRQIAARSRSASSAQGSASVNRTIDSRFPRQLTPSSAGRTTRSAGTGTRVGATDADRRVRELYRRAASPRTTRDDPSTDERQRPAPATRSRDSKSDRTSAPQASPRPRSTGSPGADRGRTTSPGKSSTDTPRRREPAATPRPSPRSGSERSYLRGTGSAETQRSSARPTRQSSSPDGAAPRGAAPRPRSETPRSTAAPAPRPRPAPQRAAPSSRSGSAGRSGGSSARPSGKGDSSSRGQKKDRKD